MYAICSTSMFPSIMAMVPSFKIFFIFSISIFKFFFINTTIFAFWHDFCCLFVDEFISFFKKIIISIMCSLKDSQNFFMQSLPLYKSCLFSMLVNGDIGDLMEYVYLLLLQINFQDYFYIHQPFLLNIKDLHK